MLFRSGEKVRVIKPEHKPLLEAEAKRRETVALKLSAITEDRKSVV